MTCIDPGHRYLLATLDGDGSPIPLDFVKREGEKYPGNVGSHPGTTLQEVWRASIDRLTYLDWQDPHPANKTAILHMELAIAALEDRAADRHGRGRHTVRDYCYGPQCPKCLHAGCAGQCRP